MLFSVAGCAGSERTATRGEPAPSAVEARGEWADVDAAVRFALARRTMAMLARRADATDLADAARITYEILTPTDHHALLQITRADASAPVEEVIPIRIEARVGRFQEDERAGALVETVRERLEALAGRGIVPGDGGSHAKPN